MKTNYTKSNSAQFISSGNTKLEGKTVKDGTGHVVLTMIALALAALQSLANSAYEPYTFTSIAGKAGSIGSTDGTSSASQFDNPYGVALDSAGNLYVTDISNCTIRKVTPVGTNWVVTTLAGYPGIAGGADGKGSAARFNNPAGVALDSAGSIYVGDEGNNTIRKVTPVGTNWVVTTLAGKAGTVGSADGTGSVARFNFRDIGGDVAVDSVGSIYVPDTFNHTIRKLTPVGTNWMVTTLAGLAGSSGSADGTGSAARFSGPSGVAVDGAGNLYVADWGDNTILKGYAALVIASSRPSFGFTGGQFGFDLTGSAGQLVVVEASTDLVSWLPLWTNTLAGSLSFSDPQSGGHADRFYRALTK